MAVLYYIGQDVPLSASVTDDSGSAATPTTITITVTDPLGASVAASAPAASSLGQYISVVSKPTVAGTYLVRWVASTTAWNWAFEDEFTVRAQGTLQVVDLHSVKTQLNMLFDSSADAELEGYIAAATELIRDIVGPIGVETHTQYFSGGVSTIVPDWLPLVSVTSAVEYYGLSAFPITEQPLGGQMNAFAFTADYSTGELTRRTFGGEAALWADGAKNVKLVYTAGYATIPYGVRLAALRLIQHWYAQFKQLHGQRPGTRGGSDGETATPMGFAVPDAVVELLAPWRRPPGIA